MDRRIQPVPIEQAKPTQGTDCLELIPTTECTPLLLRSEEVLRGHKTVAIHHNGALYRLQTTRQGKLILTK